MARWTRYLAISAAALAVLAAMWSQVAGSMPGNKVLMGSHKSTIDISLTYDGDRIIFFGLNPDPKAQLIVKLVSRAEDEVMLSVKDKFGPVWMARRQYKVSGAPVMYKVISAVPLEKLMDPAEARKLGLGYGALEDKLHIELVRGQPAPGEKRKVLNALIKIKESQGLYHLYSQPSRMHLVEGRLYSHYFSFPPTAGEGVYIAETYAMKNGHLVGYGHHSVEIRKIGLQAWITDAAQQNPFWYGLCSVLLACLAGLGVGLVFKREGQH